jgi:hypothetical protein
VPKVIATIDLTTIPAGRFLPSGIITGRDLSAIMYAPLGSLSPATVAPKPILF